MHFKPFLVCITKNATVKNLSTSALISRDEQTVVTRAYLYMQLFSEHFLLITLHTEATPTTTKLYWYLCDYHLQKTSQYLIKCDDHLLNYMN